MRRLSRRGLAQRPASPAVPDDPLDEVVWNTLSGVVVAAAAGDAATHLKVFQGWPAQVPLEGRRASLYLWYLLRYRVLEVVGRRPTPADLHELAARVYPRFAGLIRQDESHLEATFRTVFDSGASEDHLKGGMFLIMGTAALGVLLDDPEAELAAMRPHLATWWSRSSAEFREQGVE